MTKSECDGNCKTCEGCDEPPTNRDNDRPECHVAPATLEDILGALSRVEINQDLQIKEIRSIAGRQIAIEREVAAIKDAQSCFVCRDEYEIDFRRVHERLDRLENG